MLVMYTVTLQRLNGSKSGFRLPAGILLAAHYAEPCGLPNMCASVSQHWRILTAWKALEMHGKLTLDTWFIDVAVSFAVGTVTDP